MTDSQSSFYKPVAGTIIGGQYSVGDELGEGRFSYVVKGLQHGKNIAIKIYRTSKGSMSCYKNEIKMLMMLDRHPNIIAYLGTFAEITFIGYTPRINPCIVFESGGETISDLIRYCKKNHGAALPLEHTRHIMRSIFRGLSHIHGTGIVHCDIKPGNVLLDRPIESINGLSFDVKIIDFGSSALIGETTEDVGTIGYIAPEVIFEEEYSTPADIWSAFISAFQMVTGEHMIDVYDSGELEYGPDCITSIADGNDSDSEYDEASDYICQYRSLVLMEKLLGPAEKHSRKKARKYYNAKRKLMNNSKIVPITLEEFIHNNFAMSVEQVSAFAEFLRFGLKYNPQERVTASQALELEWLRE
jgi:serine/threonine protein kinase